MTISPGEAAKRFAATLALMTETQREGQALMAKIVKKSIQRTYGNADKLLELAPSTQAERVREGRSANEPLLRDGSLLRDSIKIETTATGFAVGSDEEVAAYQEFGTARIPPRPAIAIGAVEAEPEVRELMGATAQAMLGDRRRLEALAATVEADSL